MAWATSRLLQAPGSFSLGCGFSGRAAPGSPVARETSPASRRPALAAKETMKCSRSRWLQTHVKLSGAAIPAPASSQSHSEAKDGSPSRLLDTDLQGVFADTGARESASASGLRSCRDASRAFLGCRRESRVHGDHSTVRTTDRSQRGPSRQASTARNDRSPGWE
jgi:hypothetical protein